MSEESNETDLNSKNEIVSNDPNSEWQRIGFHRPLSGLLFNLIIIFIAAGFGIVLTVWVIPNLILPFPDALGYTTVTTNFFSVYFTLMDLGIGNSIQRFVAEENVKNPKKSIQYVQFFIWYEFIGGGTEVTILTLWILLEVPRSQLGYASWFFLIYSLMRYPGMNSIFQGVLNAYQRFDKASFISFIQTQVFQNVLEIFLVLLGRYYGTLNPEFGEVMGATIGAILAIYLTTFVSALLGAIWCKPVLKTIDPTYSLKNLFFHQFDKKVIKNCVSFGARVLVPNIISPIADFIVTLMLIAWMPNYSFILGMFAEGDMLATMVTTFSLTGMTSSVSEAYLNGKYNLTRYYFENVYKWLGVFSIFMLGLLFFGSHFIGVIIGPAYSMVAEIIQYYIFFKVVYLFNSNLTSFINGVNKPELNILFTGIQQVVRVLLVYLLLVPFPIIGWAALVLSNGIGWCVQLTVGLIVFHKKILKLRFNFWQSIGAPFIAAASEVGYVYILITYVYTPLSGILGHVLTAIILMLFAIGTGIFLYFTVYSLVGGFDTVSLNHLKQATELSGPSKFIIKRIRNIAITCSRISPLFNRSPIDETGVQEDIDSLLIIRQAAAKALTSK
jgi:O-antigen/teichoic acid export membrane protein